MSISEGDGFRCAQPILRAGFAHLGYAWFGYKGYIAGPIYFVGTDGREIWMVKRPVKKSTQATVCIVESLNFLDETNFKEGEIISRTLRLSQKETHYSYLRTSDEFRAFAKEFGKSNHRYLHISCHGNKGQFFMTTEMIPAEEFADILAPHVSKRRVFLSTCLAADNLFAHSLLENSDCWSVLGPAGTTAFDDAAIFWTTFYHLMFKENPSAMQRDHIERVVSQCAELVQEKFRFFYRRDGKIKEKVLG